MCSRILGLIREQVFAWLFGAGLVYDAFVVAFRIPNLLRDLFAEGALSAAFVTVFSTYDKQRSKEDTWRLASNVLNFFLLLLSLITLLTIIFADQIVGVLAPDFFAVSGKAELTALLTQIMSPFLVCISLAAVVMGILNTKGRFFVPAMASSFFNLGSIIGGTALAVILPHFGQPAILGMALGTLIGGALQLGIQLPELFRTGFSYKLRLDLTDPGLRRVLVLMLPAAIGMSATQITLFINTNFAASCGEGAVSWLYYAFRLVQLPIGIFGVALSIAILPLLARQVADKDLFAMKETMVSSLTMVFALTIPATVGLILLSQPIIRLIYQHGAFTAADTRATAEALACYALGLLAYSANKVLVPAFYALDKTKIPVIASFMAIAVNVLIVILTIDSYQHRAIALATSGTMLLNFLFLMSVLYISLGGYSLRYLALSTAKIIIATLVLALILMALRAYGGSWWHGSIIEQAAILAFAISVAGLFYICTLYLLRLGELTVLADKIRFRLTKRA